MSISDIVSYVSYTLHRHLLSFPTRRSSDLGLPQVGGVLLIFADHLSDLARHLRQLMSKVDSSLVKKIAQAIRDRRSTRLNSSHMSISYAVFCLKKKKYIK